MVDAVAGLEQVRVRFRARAELATLPLKQSALPLLDQMLGQAESTQQVFKRLEHPTPERERDPGTARLPSQRNPRTKIHRTPGLGGPAQSAF